MGRPKKEKPNRADGLYEIKITIGKTLDGKYVRKSFYSSVSKDDARRQAEEWKIAQAVSQQTGEIFVEKETPFAKWAARWLETYKKPKVSANTYRLTYQNTVEKHLVPYFGQALLTDIRPIDIEQFYSTKSGKSQSMLDKMSLCLNGIFESAMENDLCAKNPARNVHPVSKSSKRPKTALTDAQITELEEYAQQEGRWDVILLLETGMRRGELLGLRREDIDWDAQSYTVNRSVADRKGGRDGNPAAEMGQLPDKSLIRKSLLDFAENRSVPGLSISRHRWGTAVPQHMVPGTCPVYEACP